MKFSLVELAQHKRGFPSSAVPHWLFKIICWLSADIGGFRRISQYFEHIIELWHKPFPPSSVVQVSFSKASKCLVYYRHAYQKFRFTSSSHICEKQNYYQNNHLPKAKDSRRLKFHWNKSQYSQVFDEILNLMLSQLLKKIKQLIVPKK